MEEVSYIKKLGILFITTFSISATTNGGYAIVAAMRGKFVEKYHWMSEDEMLDLMSIGQSSPGPIAVNTSVLAGYKIAGMPGALVTLFGTILPPLTIMTIVTIFYEYISSNEYVKIFMHGMQAGVAAMLVSVTIDLFQKVQKEKSIFNYVLMILAFAYVMLTDLSIAYLAIACAVAGIIKVKVLTKEAK
ncbi:MAG: chromate transporter [Erysipelotrichaceae bacterium]|nr:chromate transporter [Erysipelotrichaceae bacterium]